MTSIAAIKQLLEECFAEALSPVRHLSAEQQACFWASASQILPSEWMGVHAVLRQQFRTVSSPDRWSDPCCFSASNLSAHGLRQSASEALGTASFARGEVAFLTVAGGLGTRLGFPGPKGLVGVTPLKQKPLFQVFAEKLQAMQQRYRQRFHWLIMTSEATDAATREAFRVHHWYEAPYLHFFQQGTLPALTQEGTFAIQPDGGLCRFPDGHGGVFSALKNAGLLQQLDAWGVRTIAYFQVDNPLVHLDDALYVGVHLHQTSDFSTKVVIKECPEERVGLFVQEVQRLRVVEYSDFPKNLAQERAADGALRYRFGNTAIHLLSVDFMKRCASLALPLHRCQKTFRTWDIQQRALVPCEGTKLERFIFDALPYAQHALLWEIERADEFSPVKNAVGSDTLAICQRNQCRRWLRWIQCACEAAIALQAKNSRSDADGSADSDRILLDLCRRDPESIVEVSPLLADCKKDFVEAWGRIQKPNHLQGWYIE